MKLVQVLITALIAVSVTACAGSSSARRDGPSAAKAAPQTANRGSIWDLLEEGRRLKAEHDVKVASSGGTFELPADSKNVAVVALSFPEIKQPTINDHEIDRDTWVTVKPGSRQPDQCD